MAWTRRPALPLWRKASQPQSLPISLDRRRIYTLPSRAGLAWAGLLASMFLGALNYMNNAALLICCELAGALGLSLLQGFRNLYQLRVEALTHTELIAGVVASINLSLAPGPRRRQQLSASLNDTAVVSNLAADLRQTLAVPMLLRQRGRQRLPALRLQSRWPLGLFTIWSTLQLDDPVIVWPQPEIAGPGLPFTASDSLQHGQQTQLEAIPDNLRNYRNGDAQAHIAWKILARSDQWQTKISTNSASATRLSIDWQQTAGLSHEARIARLAHWLRLAKHAQLGYSLSLPTQTLPYGVGDAHYRRCMDALACLP